MAIALRGSPTVGEGAAGSIVVNKPTGVVDGDYLIGVAVVNGAKTISAAPSGWTQFGSETGISFAGDTHAIYIYAKVASSEGSSWTWTLSGPATATLTVSAYSGVDTTTPQDVTMTANAAAASGSTVIPGATTITDNAWFVTAATQVFGGSGVLWTAPSGFTKDGEFGPATQSNRIAVGHKAITPAAATGTSTWSTTDTANFKKGFGVFLRPAGGGGDTTAPTVTARVVNGSTLTITYNEALDTSFVPSTTAFTVKVNTVARTVNNVTVGNTGAGGVGVVTLTLASAVSAGQTVTVSYAP